MAFDKSSINGSNTELNFSVKKLGFLTIKGSFSALKGSNTFDAENLADSHFDVQLTTSSINTSNNKRDEHLRSKDFFFIEEFPAISFKSSTITTEKVLIGRLAS